MWIQSENGWKRLDTREDGSYLVADIPYGAAFALLTIPDEKQPYLIIGSGAAVVVLVILMFQRHNKKKPVKRVNQKKNGCENA